MRSKLKQRFSIIVLTTWSILLPALGWAIDELTAKQIAENAAGCAPAKPCKTRVRMIEKEQWSVIVSYIRGYRENGEPILTPGDWVGFTISEDGKIVDRMPGL